jgi:hypothetical protein
VKIAGPFVSILRKEIVSWTLPRPADGEEPQYVSGDLFLVQRETDLKRMQQLVDQLSYEEPAPPLVYFARLLDPWTVAPVLSIYSALRGRGMRLRLARSDSLDCLFIHPSDWASLLNELARYRNERENNAPEQQERDRLFVQLTECAGSWENLLSATYIERAVLIASLAIGGSWLDEEVLEGSLVLPSWYHKSA